MHNNVEVCEHAGFCFGAGRGVESLENALKESVPLYSFGPILNNDKLVEDFSKRGVTVVNDVEEFDKLAKGRVVIRAHGVSEDIYNRIVNTGFEVIDATCPFVKRIHNIVREKSLEGYRIVVVGNSKHPEVLGIVGWCVTPATVLETFDEVEKFHTNGDEKICIVAQTTFNRKKFQEFLDIFDKRGYNMCIMNTICDATRVRQSEAEELAGRASLMIVIGDEKSSNSRKLYEICKANCIQTYFIQTVEDIKGKLPDTDGLIGITAGASTPRYIIEEVQDYVRNEF